MSEFLMQEEPVEALIDAVEQLETSDISRLPQDIIDEISIRPEWVIRFIQHLTCCNESLDNVRTKILFSLIEEGLSQIRYSLDRKEKKGQLLLNKTQAEINHIIHDLPQNILIFLNQIIFHSKLIIEIQQPEGVYKGENAQVDIMPLLPELLERLRIEKGFKNAFELYDLMLSQLQLMPVMTQLATIAELAHSKKTIAHEVAVLMLLHPKATIRGKVADLLYQLSDDCVFTPIDLRRLIMIRNWVPLPERAGIDKIIAHLRKNKCSPAPYPVTRVTRLVSSSMDGAGAAYILIESKKNTRRFVAGFIFKIDAGLREPWIIEKAPKHCLDEMIKGSGTVDMPTKPVSTTYVTKMVQHFLSESLKNNEVPEPAFIRIAEIFNASNWQPQPLSWSDELNKLTEKYANKLTDSFIKASLKRSGQWHLNQDIAKYWAESGEIAEQSIIKAMKAHEQNPSAPLGEVATEYLMKHCLEKWKAIFLVTCLWMRTKDVDKRCEDLFTVLHCLDNKVSPASIPLFCNISSQTAAIVIRRGWRL